MKRIAAALAAVLGLALAQTYTLRFNHVLGPNHPYHAGFQAWAERVAQRTGGDLRILVFHSSQLGIEEDIIEQLRQGIPLGQNTDGARLGNYVKELGVFNGPYFVESYEEVEKLASLPVVQGWVERLAKQYGIRVVCFNWVQGYRHFMTNKPVRRPEDLRGLRIRTPPAPVWQESVRALGATPVALPFGEIYSALQQRAIDGAELVYANIPDMSLWEVLRYVNETKHFLLINFQVVGEAWYQRLPAPTSRPCGTPPWRPSTWRSWTGRKWSTLTRCRGKGSSFSPARSGAASPPSPPPWARPFSLSCRRRGGPWPLPRGSNAPPTP